MNFSFGQKGNQPSVKTEYGWLEASLIKLTKKIQETDSRTQIPWDFMLIKIRSFQTRSSLSTRTPTHRKIPRKYAYIRWCAPKKHVVCELSDISKNLNSRKIFSTKRVRLNVFFSMQTPPIHCALKESMKKNSVMTFFWAKL